MKNKKTALVIMAAGMGSRFGGLKQLTPVGPAGELIIDYSIFDAKRAGFDKVYFIIKDEIYKDFDEIIGSRVSKYIETEYIMQELSKLPEGFTAPEGRTKPLGTGHAVWCGKDAIKEDFVVINADDYYGPECFKILQITMTAAINYIWLWLVLCLKTQFLKTDTHPVESAVLMIKICSQA